MLSVDTTGEIRNGSRILQSAYNFYGNGRHSIRIVYSIGLAGELCRPCIIIQMDALADNT